MPEAAIAAIVGAIVLLLIASILAWVKNGYNRLVRQRDQVRTLWAQIDGQLKRRSHLIPFLVETVEGYAAHERDTLDAVVQARNSTVTAADAGAPPAQRAEAEKALTATLDRFLELADDYPKLRADHNFLRLHSELAATEDKIAYARQFYNRAVQTFNTTVQAIPTRVIASAAGFRVATLFEVAGAEHGPIQVRS